MLFEILKEKPVPELNQMKNNHSADFISSQDDYLRKHLINYELRADNTAIHFTSNGMD